jgi:arginyl-tRNA synthetase
MIKIIEKTIQKTLNLESLPSISFIEENIFGDVTTNVAMVNAKKLNKNPKDLAQEYVNVLNADSEIVNLFSKIQVAGPGFINFTFSESLIKKELESNLNNILEKIKENSILNNKNILVEYTDPNPFKVFHIGHLMTNIIGEAIAGINELAGAKVSRINYQGDVGRHIAINIYAILKEENYAQFLKFKNDGKDGEENIKAKVKWLGERYAEGYADFDVNLLPDGVVKGKENLAIFKNFEKGSPLEREVAEINKKIYDRSDQKINDIYDMGKKWSMDYFEVLYKMLGTSFDKYIMESEGAPIGLKIVNDNNGVGEKSIFEIGDEGAIIFDGEKEGLHKRVFINKNGLPTYEAKDLGNMQIKLGAYPKLDQSIVVTANEQIDYFKVLYKVMEKINPELTGKLKHYGHGMMRFADGKMSSRKGNIIAGDKLIENIAQNLQEKFASSRVDDEIEKKNLIEKVAIGAIKYAVLKQGIGRDVIFDMEKAISVDGDSGPYLQYTHARINGLLIKNIEKLREAENSADLEKYDTDKLEINTNNKNLIVNILKYESILLEVIGEAAPQKLLTYLINLTHSFNAFYNIEKIEGNMQNIFIAKKVKDILAHGLKTLAIHAPDRM